MPSYLRYVRPEDLQTSPPEVRPDEQAVLNEINQKVAAGETLDAIMAFLFAATRELWTCDRIGLAFLENDGARAVARYVRADYEPIVLREGFWQDLRDSSLHQVLAAGCPRVIDDLVAYQRDHPQSPSAKLLVKEGVRSSMTCPLVVEDRVVGFLFRSSRQVNAYDDRQVRLHLMVAERMSQAVEKAWQIEQLTAANQAYMEMLGFVTHELKSPLASIILDGRVLVDGYLGELAPKQTAKIERIMAKCEFLTDLIRDYLNLARLEGGRLRADIRPGVEMAPIITRSLSMLAPQIIEQSVHVDQQITPEDLTAACDPELMQIVWVNLIGNAVKYGNPEGRVRITLSAADGMLHGSVWNEGPGFPESEKSKLFRRFSRLKTPELLSRKGSGVGLYTVWQIIRAHGGRVWAESEEASWAAFNVEFPLVQPGKNNMTVEKTAASDV